eukprot:RCo008281
MNPNDPRSVIARSPAPPVSTAYNEEWFRQFNPMINQANPTTNRDTHVDRYKMKRYYHEHKEMSEKLHKLDLEFERKMQDQVSKFFPERPDESTLSPAMRAFYQKYDHLLAEHIERFKRRMQDHTEAYKGLLMATLEHERKEQFDR